MKLSLHIFNLELKHSFAISRWTYTHTPSMIVELSDGGISGLGEATRNAYYPNTEIEHMSERLQAIEGLISASKNKSPSAFWDAVHPHLEDSPFALCALDEAYHDWFTKTKGIPLYQYWGLNPAVYPPNCYTLSIDAIEVMIERMRQMPWDVYKIKLGTPNDIAIVEALRKHTDAKLWVDANGAWTVDETIRKSKELARLGVEFIEQPLPGDQWNEMEEVFQKSALPLFADESCKTFADIEKCKNRFHGVNIKVMKCGGLTPALKMIRETKKLELKVMLGCMTESTVGISAVAHLLPLLNYADMDGAMFLKTDIASGVRITNNGPVFTESAGTGAVLI